MTLGSIPVDLPEWSTKVLPKAELSEADWSLAEALSSGDRGRLDVEAHRGGVRIRARSWVGVVRFERIEVRVVPKLAGGNVGLVKMIELTTGLDTLRRTSAMRDLDAGGSHLFDLIALLLAEACERIARQGLFADYIERESDLPVLRGRLLADRQVLRRFGQVDRLECRFDELDRDAPENRLLALALTAAGRRVENATVRRRVRRLQALFHETCSIEGADPTALLDSMVYHRLNEHYRDAHDLARILLEGLGVDDVLRGGDTQSFAFLIDMNRLFEAFVRRLFERLLAGRPYRVHYQKANRSILWNIGANRSHTHVVPDLLIERSSGEAVRLPIDAKYKLYEGRKVSTGDVYQAFLYAYAYGEEALSRQALLLHPASSDRDASPMRLAVRDAQGRSGAEIQVLSLPVPALLDELSAPTPGPRSRKLLDVVEQAIGRGAR